VLESMRAAQVYESEVFTRLIDGLGEIAGVSQLPAPPLRCPTVSFRVADQHPAETAERLGAEGVCVFSGDNYAYEYFEAMGLRDSGGAVRASVYHYNTAEDVARILDALKRVSST
jgi:selenocysteine lyase/cysteine desulfurase